MGKYKPISGDSIAESLASSEAATRRAGYLTAGQLGDHQDTIRRQLDFLLSQDAWSASTGYAWGDDTTDRSGDGNWHWEEWDEAYDRSRRCTTGTSSSLLVVVQARMLLNNNSQLAWAGVALGFDVLDIQGEEIIQEPSLARAAVLQGMNMGAMQLTITRNSWVSNSQPGTQYLVRTRRAYRLPVSPNTARIEIRDQYLQTFVYGA